MQQIEVIENPAAQQFELIVDGAPAGHIDYRMQEGRIVLVYTELDGAYAGRGLGSAIATGTMDLIRASGRPLVVDCPFLVRWLDRNPEYADLPVEVHRPAEPA